MVALRRFGLPQKMINVISSIYTDREFTVLDDGVESSHRSQRAGISQGCPLSPFLFGILMTMLMEDAYGLLSPDAKAAHTSGNLGEVLYADDTLIPGTAYKYVEEYMLAIEACGKQYGLQIHAGKLQLVSLCQKQEVKDPSGKQIPSQDSMLYLGATLHHSGRAVSETSRKIGMATGQFKVLNTIWKHAAISLTRKIEIFTATICSRLVYATASSWLMKSDLRRLDGFFCSCLRKILRIPHSFYSRVSNADVCLRAGCRMLSSSIRESQLKLLGRVMHDPAKKVLRNVAFHGETETSETAAWVRRRGRPRQNWTEQLMQQMQQACGSAASWNEAVQSAQKWNEVVSCIYPRN